MRSFVLFLIALLMGLSASAEDRGGLQILTWADLEQDRMSNFAIPDLLQSRIIVFSDGTENEIADPYIRAQAKHVNFLILSILNGGYMNNLLNDTNEDRFKDYTKHKIFVGFTNSRSASATFTKDGRPIIVMDPNWLGITDSEEDVCFCASPAGGVLAHEIAHLLLGHPNIEGLEWEKEFEADAAAGRAIRRVAAYADYDDDEKHPYVQKAYDEFGYTSSEYREANARAFLIDYAESSFSLAPEKADKIYPSRKDRVLRFLPMNEEESKETFVALDFDTYRPKQTRTFSEDFFNLWKEILPNPSGEWDTLTQADWEGSTTRVEDIVNQTNTRVLIKVGEVNMNAAVLAGLVYKSGLGLPKNYDRTLGYELFRKACDAGKLRGCFEFAFIRLDSEDEITFHTRSLRYLQEGCDKGFSLSCAGLAKRHYDGARGVAENKKKAAELYDYACRRNHGLACVSLHDMYLKGDGVAKDLAKAADIRWKACDKSNDASICLDFGGLFFYGKGVTKNKAEALRYYDRACELNDRWGVCSTANSLRIDMERVSDWTKRCDAGDTQACFFLGKAYYEGRNEALEEDVMLAIKYLNRSCGASAQGCATLSDIYLLEQRWGDHIDYKGLKSDKDLAVTYRQIACDFESKWACEWLEKNQGDIVGRLTRDANLIFFDRWEIPPNLAKDVKTSGYCDFQFDVLPNGTPSNIKAKYCTHPSLMGTIASSMQSWLFTPRFVNGKPALQRAAVRRMGFTVRDAEGNKIPFTE